LAQHDQEDGRAAALVGRAETLIEKVGRDQRQPGDGDDDGGHEGQQDLAVGRGQQRGGVGSLLHDGAGQFQPVGVEEPHGVDDTVDGQRAEQEQPDGQQHHGDHAQTTPEPLHGENYTRNLDQASPVIRVKLVARPAP